jgi:uncharacterized membrane protein YgcG
MATRAFTPQGQVHFFIFEPFGLAGGTGSSGEGPATPGFPGGCGEPGGGGKVMPWRLQ